MRALLTIGLATLTFLLYGNIANAGIFARGGGELRHIDAVTPGTAYNGSHEVLTVRGRFSARQANRRVTITGPQVPAPMPVSINRWSERSITVTLPPRLAPGRYQLMLQRTYHNAGQPRWQTISNNSSFTVLAGARPGNRDGSPHAVPIRRRSEESICAGQPLHIVVRGAAFQRSGRPFPITAQARTRSGPASARVAPHVRILSASEAEVAVPRCFVLNPGAEIRLVYPDRSHSNWLSVEQHPDALSERTGHAIQPLRPAPAR